jgi:hypothetical protein
LSAGKSACKHLGQIDIEAGRVELEARAGDDARLDGIAHAALVVDQQPPIRIDDEVMGEAG